MKSKFFIILSILILVTHKAISQPKKIQKIDIVMNNGQYLTARDMYLKLYPKLKERDQKADVSYKIGFCSRQIRDYKTSVIWFKRAISSKYQDPLVYLYYADALRMKGDYEEARANYSIFKDLMPDDPRGEEGIRSCDLAKEWIDKPTRYSISEIPTITTRDNEFAPFIVPNDTNIIYFTSTRTATKGNKLNTNSGVPFADIYFAQKDLKGVWSQPQAIEINSEFDDGVATIESDGLKMYYTYCPIIKGKEAPCMIMSATKVNNQWSNKQKITLFSDTTISCGHPYLSPDDLTMYFVSNNPKGIGGKDIWYTTRSSKSSNWSTPQNLGSEINTKYDELFPSIDKEGTIYFSSEGRIGMGGFDIYKAQKNTGNWIVENLKVPINSSADDYSITFNPNDNNYGYFASNRGTKGDDIYAFYVKPIEITLIGYVINDANRAFLPDVTVEITASDGTIFKVTTAFDGSFTTKLKTNIDYNLITNKKGFLKAAAFVSTKGITQDGKQLEVTLRLVPSIGVVKIPNIRYNFNDTTLREESKVALDELLELLKINPNIVIELRANTDFRGDEKYNQKLSQGRANSVVDYLVKQGIPRKRLVPIGLGETSPFVVDKNTADAYPFLKEGNVLNEKFINLLNTEEQKEICHELNRRTEFKVIKEDFQNYQTFGDN